MGQQIQVKIDKELAKEHLFKTETIKYKDKATGEDKSFDKVVIAFNLVEMKEESKKVIYDHEKYQLIKTHFAVKEQTKEERESDAPSIFVGEGISRVWKNDSSSSSQPVAAATEEADDDDLPF